MIAVGELLIKTGLHFYNSLAGVTHRSNFWFIDGSMAFLN